MFTWCQRLRTRAVALPPWRTPLLLVLVALWLWNAPGVPRAQAAMAAAPKAYIGLFKENAVAVLDTQTNRVHRTIPVPAGPHGLVITPDGKKVYVSSDGASTVSVIDTATDKVVGHIEVGPNPHGLALSPDGRQVLVSGFGANELLLIDTGRDQVTQRLAIPMPHNSVASPDGRQAYVGSQKQGETGVVIVDLAQHKQTGYIPLEQTPRTLAVSGDGKQLYVTVAGSNEIQVIDPAQQRVVGHVAVGASPHLTVMLPNNTEGLAVCQGPGTLERFSTASAAVHHTVRVGKAPHWVAVSSDGQRAYVTNEASNDLTVVDLSSNAVLASVPVGNAPRKIAVQPGTIPAPEGAVGATSMHAHGSGAAADHGTLDVTGKTAIAIEADDSYFAPTFLIGTAGQRLQLTIENESGTLHNFSLPEQHLDVDVPPKGKKTVDVVFPTSGSIRFFCKIHEALGMYGALQHSATTQGAEHRAR